MTREKEAIVRNPRSRPEREQLGVRNILTVRGKDPSYEYRIVNDDPGRIENFLAAGWEFEDANKVKVGESRVDNPRPEGTHASLNVGRVAPRKAYVMRIPKEWYKEDQDRKQAKVDQLEGTMKEETRAAGGSLNITKD